MIDMEHNIITRRIYYYVRSLVGISPKTLEMLIMVLVTCKLYDNHNFLIISC